MRNIEYLEQFFRKHKLSGKVKVKYDPPITVDDYMSDIVFENGDIININDIIFDIDSDFPEDLVEQWLEDKRKNDISLVEWVQENPNYFPKDFIINIINTSTYENTQRNTSLHLATPTELGWTLFTSCISKRTGLSQTQWQDILLHQRDAYWYQSWQLYHNEQRRQGRWYET